MNKINCSATITPVKTNPLRIGFITREKDEEWMPGKLCVPGGRVESGDGEIIEGLPYFPVEYGAVRELEEETGIKVSASDLKFFCSLIIPKYDRVVISLYCYVSKLTDSGSVIWLTENELTLSPNDKFAPGMKEEALMLFKKLEEVE